MTVAFWVGIGAALAIRYPWLWVLLAVFFAGRQLQHRHAQSELRRQGEADVLTAGRAILVGLASGLPLPAALSVASEETGALVAAELRWVLRQSRRNGMAVALATAAGDLTRPLLARLARAQVSGAPMAGAVSSYLAEEQGARRSHALEKVRRLPVTLMVPLGLLILPGFVVLFVGPIVVGSILELFGGLP